jgi:hypothetical protein
MKKNPREDRIQHRIDMERMSLGQDQNHIYEKQPSEDSELEDGR